MERLKTKKLHDRQVECPSDLPLNQFKPGQRLYVQFRVMRQHIGDATAEFVRIERGLVVVRFVDGDYLRPDWMDWHDMKKQFPGLEHKTRAARVYLWAQGKGDGWPRCHWFKNIRSPAT